MLPVVITGRSTRETDAAWACERQAEAKMKKVAEILDPQVHRHLAHRCWWQVPARRGGGDNAEGA